MSSSSEELLFIFNALISGGLSSNVLAAVGLADAFWSFLQLAEGAFLCLAGEGII